VIIDEIIDARRLMGAFWNPNGGLIVNGRKLSNKEVAGIKRKWSASLRQRFGSLKCWWKKIKIIVCAFLS
jgi:hypothetical protein